ncbi:MAG: archease [Anaerolineaceae bacterium]
MKKLLTEGFREVGHGADAALEVWARDLPALFRQAAQGMYSLMGATPSQVSSTLRSFKLSAADDESLLVMFLSRLLFLLDQERLMFTKMEFHYLPGRLIGILEGTPLGSIQREIKAVTFNDLEIRQEERLYRVLIVFDL